jgi:hypothetical protein
MGILWFTSLVLKLRLLRMHYGQQEVTICKDDEEISMIN